MKNNNIKILVISLMCSSILSCISTNAMQNKSIQSNNVVFNEQPYKKRKIKTLYNNTNMPLNNNQQNNKVLEKRIEYIIKGIENSVKRINSLYDSMIKKYGKEENFSVEEKIYYNGLINDLRKFFEDEYTKINRINSNLASTAKKKYEGLIAFIPMLGLKNNIEKSENKINKENIILKRNLKHFENKNQNLNNENEGKGQNIDLVNILLKKNAILKKENGELRKENSNLKISERKNEETKKKAK